VTPKLPKNYKRILGYLRYNMPKACDESFEYQISYRMKTLILASDAFKGMSELMFIPKLFIYKKKIR